MTRSRAFAIHLTASAAVMLLFLSFLLLVWFPPPYFEIDGGWTGLRILAGVHVVLGPLLTWIVFKPGKPGLNFDMGVILTLQLAALAYGGVLIYHQRPAFTVFAVDRFTVIRGAEVEFDRLRYPELQGHDGFGPLLAQALPPEDPRERQALMFDVVLNGARDWEYRAELYHPYPLDLADLRRRSIDLGPIAARDAQVRRLLKAFLDRYGGEAEDYLYFPLQGKLKDVILVLSPADGQPAGWIDIDPWRLSRGGGATEAGSAASGVEQVESGG